MNFEIAPRLSFKNLCQAGKNSFYVGLMCILIITGLVYLIIYYGTLDDQDNNNVKKNY